MTQEWMKDSTLEGIDPAKMALLQSLIQQGSKKNQNEMLAFLMSAAANSKKNGLQFSPGEMDMITKVLKKRKIITGNCKNGSDLVDDENASEGIKR
ncbi:MAG: hypothetical protein ACLUTZ_04790 [Oliverpabstia sp.]